MDNHLAHYAQANTVNGSPFVIETGFGRPQLLALRNTFDALRQQIAGLDDEGGELSSLRSERDDIFGENGEDDDEVWFWLKLYKGAVKSRLGGRHPLTRTMPNLGKIQPKNYLETLRRYIVHWTRVNAALPNPPNGMHTDFWDGITLVGDLDEFELRTAAGLTLATGTLQNTLPEPVTPPQPL